jgi:mannitol/fructose-specific phosphotransferase system IIA component (Ntr-type)
VGRLISEIFDLQSINLDLAGNTKETAFDELIKSIVVLRPEYNRDELFTAIMERESKMSTGIGNGVAIPHAYCTGTAGMVGAIGISKHGIDYNSFDNKPVQVVFLLIINNDANENHLYILNLINNLAQSEKLALFFIANNAEEAHAILSRM